MPDQKNPYPPGSARAKLWERKQAEKAAVQIAKDAAAAAKAAEQLVPVGGVGRKRTESIDEYVERTQIGKRTQK